MCERCSCAWPFVQCDRHRVLRHISDMAVLVRFCTSAPGRASSEGAALADAPDRCSLVDEAIPMGRRSAHMPIKRLLPDYYGGCFRGKCACARQALTVGREAKRLARTRPSPSCRSRAGLADSETQNFGHLASWLRPTSSKSDSVWATSEHRQNQQLRNDGSCQA